MVFAHDSHVAPVSPFLAVQFLSLVHALAHALVPVHGSLFHARGFRAVFFFKEIKSN